jgi:hypothetical protein
MRLGIGSFDIYILVARESAHARERERVSDSERESARESVWV